jgi:D-beta-D-heptose 7-phosphate kinase/D-beta-D-heptose 1-phosphate adenosyltransferase
MEWKPARKKVKALKNLAKELKPLHEAGKKVVFTNGVFDILHVGHVRLMEFCKKQGDILVVALNSDESVKRLKGPDRPLNALLVRAELMAALETVDYVTWYEEDQPLNAILAVRPDVLVKGGDYKLTEIVGMPEVKSWGGKTLRFKPVAGQSTTGLLKKAHSMKKLDKKKHKDKRFCS